MGLDDSLGLLAVFIFQTKSDALSVRKGQTDVLVHGGGMGNVCVSDLPIGIAAGSQEMVASQFFGIKYDLPCFLIENHETG